MSKQLELPITPRKRVAIAEPEPFDADASYHDHLMSTHMGGYDPKDNKGFEEKLETAMHAIDACGPTQVAVPPTHAIVDGVLIEYTPWFNGWEHGAPPRNGWYEVDVAGQLFPFNGYWHEATQDFRQGDADGQTEHYALNNCRWRGLTQPAPGGYGKDRGKRVTRTPVMPRRRVILAD